MATPSPAAAAHEDGDHHPDHDQQQGLHIAMFPWLAFGHMIPYLELAKLIAQKNIHKISFISTPLNIRRLSPPSSLTNITFVSLPFPVDHHTNLPDSAEATTDLPYHMVPLLKDAFDTLQQPLTDFLLNSRVDFLLYDFAPHWLPSIASNLRISHAFFSIFTAVMIAFVAAPSFQDDNRTKPEDFAVPPKWVPFPTTCAYRPYEIKKIFDSVQHEDDSKIPDIKRFREVCNGCEMILIRSCHEYEPEWIKLLNDIHQKPVLPVGLLPSSNRGNEETDNDTWSWMKQWLDVREKGSVVYVAFGSEAKPTQSELTELAIGLELSDLPFFWVLRKQRGAADTELIELPDGFEERTRGRGVVWTSWAPQLNIIAHDSVGGFLTHAGFTSVVEALQHKRALIMLPLLADQGLNARILEEKRIGYPIPRDELDGSFTRDSVAESLRLVMVEEEGKVYREKTEEMSQLFGDRELQDRYVEELLGHLISHRAKSDKNGNGE